MKVILLCFAFISGICYGADSLSYSGRLVNTNGSPVVGSVDLKIDLAYSGSTGIILCTDDIPGVALTNGVFHVKLELLCGTSLSEVLSSVPTGQEVVIRVTNTTPNPDKVYSFQPIHSIPSALVAHGLAKLNANNDEVLTWTGTKWEPKPVSGPSGGTVTSVAAGSGLLGGTITNSGTLSVDIGTSAGKIPQLDGSGKLATSVETDPSVQSFAKSALPSCGVNQVLKSNGTSFSCVSDIDTDTTLVADGTTLFTTGLTIGVKAQGLLDTHLSGISSSCGLNQILVTNGLGSFACADKQWGENTGNLFFATGSVTIGGNTPMTSALLDLQSTTKGFLPPRLTTTQRDLIASPAAGLMVYNSTLNSLQFYNGSVWKTLSGDNTILDSGTLSGTATLTKSVTLTEDATVILTGYFYGSNYPVVTLQVAGANCAHDRSYADTGNQYGSATCIKDLAAGTHDLRSVYSETVGNANMISHSMSWVVISKNGSGGGSGGGGGGALVADSVNSSHVLNNSLTVDDVNFASAEGINFPQLVSDPASPLTGQMYYNSTANSLSFFNGSSWQTLGISGAVSADSVDSSKILDGSISGSDISNSTVTYSHLNLTDGVIPEAKVNGLTAALAGKEPFITAGTNTQYWRGDKTWQTLNTTVVPEGTNLYFLDSRVRAALMSGYGVGSALPLAATDTLIEALGKLEAQIIANDTAFDNSGVWSKNASNVYYSAGNVGVGTTTPTALLNAFINTATYTQPLFRVQQGGAFSVMTDYVANFQTYGNRSLLGNGTQHGLYVQAGWDSDINNTEIARFSSLNSGFADVPRMVIKSDGKVGIGKTSPSVHMEVGGMIGSNVVGEAKHSALILSGNDAYNNYVIGRKGGALPANNRWVMNLGNNYLETGSNAGSDFSLSRWSDAGVFLEDALFVRRSNGYVGVGTSIPERKLHVVGDIKSEATEAYNVIESRTSSETNYSPHFILRRSRGTSAAPAYVQTGDTMGLLTYRNHTAAQGASIYSYATENHNASDWGANLMFSTIPNGSNMNTPRMTIDHNGNVGIGTTTPTAKLDIASTGGETVVLRDNDNVVTDVGFASYIRAKDSAGTSVWYVGDGSSAAAGLWLLNYQANPIHFATDGSTRMTVSGTGNVGIGDSAPTYKLDVVGDINSTTRLRIAGTQVCTSAGCTASSDRRLKEKISPLENGLENILKLQAVEYVYKDREKFGDKKHIGVIAQDVEKVYPEVVVTDSKTGFKSVAYDHLVAPLIESVKSLHKMIIGVDEKQIQLERKIASHQAEIITLKNKNADKDEEIRELKKYLCTKDPGAPICK